MPYKFPEEGLVGSAFFVAKNQIRCSHKGCLSARLNLWRIRRLVFRWNFFPLSIHIPSGLPAQGGFFGAPWLRRPSFLPAGGGGAHRLRLFSFVSWRGPPKRPF